MKYKISDIAEINKKNINKNYKGKVFYLDTSSVTNDFFNCPKIYTSLKEAPIRARRLAEDGDTIISTVRPAMRHVGYISQNLNRVYSTGFAIISPKKSKVNPFYLYLVLSSKEITNLLQSIAVGSTSAYPSIKPRDIGNLTFDFPSLCIQEKIASIMQQIILKIKMNNQINDNLLELMDKLFNSFFPNINVGYDQIGSFIKNYDRFRKPLSKKQRSEIPGNYRYIGATSVMDHINQYNFNGIYLLLGEDGTVVDDNGYPILQYIFGKFWPNNHTHVLKGKDISTEWLYLFFRQRKVSNIVTGAVQKKISQKNLHSLTFRSPSKDNYLKFDKIIQPIFKSIRIRMKENSSLFQLKQILLKRYF